MIKVYLRNKENFFTETIDAYSKFATLTTEEEADILVINNFDPIESNKPVACNSTGIEHIKAPKIISLRGEDLSGFTAVSELCLAMAIILLRQQERELKGKLIGLIGYGRIAKQFEKYLLALGASVIATDIAQKEGVTLEGVLENADIVSLHITADESNREFLRKEHFEKMKRGAILLNSARPWLINEEALKWALEKKEILYWADFYSEELEKQFYDQGFFTSHQGGSTQESRLKSELLIAEKVRKLYAK